MKRIACRGKALLTLVCASILATAPAVLAAGPPREPPVVAGPTAGGARLLAFDRGNELCGSVKRGRVFDSRGDCDRPSGRLRDPFLQTDYDGRGRRAWHWGFVAPEVMEVELVFAGNIRARVPTEAGSAYRGRHAGRVRFFVAETEGRVGRERLYVKLLGANGSTLAVVGHDLGSPPRVGEPVNVTSGGAGRNRWRLLAFGRRSLAPLPGNEERFIEQACIEVRTQRGRSQGEVCDNPELADRPYLFSSDEECVPPGRVATGLVSADAQAVEAVLGDGRVRRLRLHGLPARFGGKRAFVLVAGAQVAVRRIVGVDRNGSRTVLTGGLAPISIRCGDDAVFGFFRLVEPPRPEGPPAFSVYDDGVQLCATLSSPPSPGGDCGYPPLQEEDAILLRRYAEGRTLLAGVVPSYVTSAVVHMSDGRRIRVETSFEGPYSGQYRGLIRFLSLELPGRQTIEYLTLLDAAGQRVSLSGVDFAPRVLGVPVTLLRTGGGLRLVARRMRYPLARRAFACVRLVHGQVKGSERGCGLALGETGSVLATCSPRRIVLWGSAKGLRSVRVLTAARAVRARIVRLPRRLGTPGLRAYLAVIPAAAAPRRLEVEAGGRTRRRAFELPAAARQCGYSTVHSLPASGVATRR